MVKFYVISISKFGDTIGKKLLISIKTKKPDAEFYGVGGKSLNLSYVIEFQKLHDSLYKNGDNTKHSHKDYDIINDIFKVKPEVIITIGNWEFCKEILKKINHSPLSNKIVIIHYIAPSIHYKSDFFVKNMSQQIDLLISTFPQEVVKAKKHKLPCAYVGHPMYEISSLNQDFNSFMKKTGLSFNDKILTIILETEVDDSTKSFPDIIKLIKSFKKQKDAPKIVMLSAKKSLQMIQDEMDKNGLDVYIFDEDYEFDNVMKVTQAAIATSPRSTFRLSSMLIPHVIMHKEDFFSRLNFFENKFHLLNQINELVRQDVIPVFYRSKYNLRNIRKQVSLLLNHSGSYDEQIDAFRELKQLLYTNKKPSTENTADAILSFIKGYILLKKTS